MRHIPSFSSCLLGLFILVTGCGTDHDSAIQTRTPAGNESNAIHSSSSPAPLPTQQTIASDHSDAVVVAAVSAKSRQQIGTASATTEATDGNADSLPAVIDLPPDARGIQIRVSHEVRDGKYPIIRIEESIGRDANGRPQILNHKEMVADHLLITVAPGTTPQQVTAIGTRLGMTVLSRVGQGDSYLLGFALKDTDSLPNALRAA